MLRTRSLLVVVVAAGLVLGMVPAPAAGQDVVTLTVTVETPDGEPVGNADLTATWDGGSATEDTASNGKAFLDVPAGSTVEIAVDHPDYIRNDPFVVEDVSEDNVKITVYERATTAFVVEDSSGPVEDASVTLFRHNRVAFAEQTVDGEISTGDLEAGEYLLVVEKPGYFVESQEITLEPGTNPAFTVGLEQGTVTLELNVTDPYFDPARPIAEVRAEVDDVGTVQTQSNGKQQINVPVNTERTITFTKDEYEPVERTVEVEEESLTLDISMPRADDLEVTVLNDQVVVGQPVFIEVVDEYGDPVANGTVLLDGETVATTEADGQARFVIDTEGDHSIRVQKDNIDSGETIVTGITPGEATTETTTTTTTTPTTTTTTTTEPTTEVPVPGFGPVLAVLGIVVGLGLALRRRE